MIISLTKHAVERGKDRLNLSESALQRTAQKAFEQGVHHEHLKGNLRKWALWKMSDHRDTCNHIRILGHQAFCFYNHHLITVLVVSLKLRPKAHKPPMKLSQLNRPEEDFEEEDLDTDEGIHDIR